ncbi:hypothetical protein EJD97_021136, partial [Solanum chilense]
ICPVQRECAVQTNLSYYIEFPVAIGDQVGCTNDNSKHHTSAAYLPFRWSLARSSKEVSRLLHSVALRSRELNFVVFPRAKRMDFVSWVNVGMGSEERPKE